MFMGDVVDIGAPSADTVSTAKIQDDAVTAAKLANSINTEITANTAKVTNATHTGDVTGATALTIATDAVDIAMLSATGTADATTFLRGDNAWGAAGVVSQLLVPSGPADGALWHDTTAHALKFYDGTIWWTLHTLLDGSTSAKAITSDTPITALLTARGESDGSVTPGIYWFKNGQGGTYISPTYVSNYDGKTWMLVQKNFPPQAYKTGDSVNSTDAPYSYGLMDAAGAAVITSNLTNTTPSAATLGINHARVYIDSFPTATFAKMLVVDRRDHWHRFNSISSLHAKFIAGASTGATEVNNETFSADDRESGATVAYFMFSTKWTAGDVDWSRMGLTDNSSNDHDGHNDPAEYEGISYYSDGGGTSGYSSTSRDSTLNGDYGYFSIWVAE
jgi:hypothetical protein